MLLIGVAGEPHIENVKEIIKAKGGETVEIQVDLMLHGKAISSFLENTGELSLHLEEQIGSLSLSSISSVFCRPYPEWALKAKHQVPLVEQFLQRECFNLLKMVWEWIRDDVPVWVNPWDVSDSAANKGRQLKLASKLGLKIPKTLITFSNIEAKKFISEAHAAGKKIVIKTLSGFHNPQRNERAGSFVRQINENELDEINYPLLLQEYMEKQHELRVTVVDNKCFACKILSQNSPNEASRIDWRVYDFEHVDWLPAVLDAKTESALIEMVKIFGLNYAAIDLICSPDGKITFLELNPNGLWLWVEKLSGLPISEAVADFLLRH
ncbi:MAG: hypothetical protein V1661_02185 [bacterium]